MAYGDKYVIPFKDDDLHWWRLVISKDDYSGIKYDNIIMGEDPVQIEWQSDNDYFKPIIGSSCRIHLYVQSDYGALEWQDENVGNWEDQVGYTWDADALSFMNPDYDRQWRIRVEYAIDDGTTTSTTSNKLVDSGASFGTGSGLVAIGDAAMNTTDGTYAYVTAVANNELTLDADIFTSGENYRIMKPYWVGFVVQDEYQRPLKVFPYKISFYAADLISTIDGYNYSLTTETPTAFEALRECLRQVNLEDPSGTSGNSLDFGYKFLCRVKPTGESDGNPFAQTYIKSKEAMNDENGNNMDCKTILESLLQMFNCRIFQHNGQWTIISLDALALSTFSGSGKSFTTYDKNGSNASTYSITDPVKSINSTENADTLQPLQDDLIKIIKRPAVRNKTFVNIKDMNRNEFDNGGFETVGSQGVGTNSWGFVPTEWTFADSTEEYCVNSSSVNTSASPSGCIPMYPPTMYAGTYALISEGISSSVPASPMMTNATGDTSSMNQTGDDIKFSFAALAKDCQNSGVLSYTIRWRLKIGTLYYDSANDRWQGTSVVNTKVGSIQEQWIVYEYAMKLPDVGGGTNTITIDFYKSNESAYQNSQFRMYFDDIKLSVASEMEYYTATAIATKTTIKNNSGVIPAVENRFGMLKDNAYINCLVDSSGDAIASYSDFDLAGTWDLEILMNLKRLNDLAVNNETFNGTFRKIKSSNGFLEPVDMLTLPKLDFTTVQSINNRLAIDKLQVSIKKNRIQLNTHTPTQSNLTTSSDINMTTGFFKFKPED